MNSDIPETWLSLKLGDVVTYGKTEKAEPDTIPKDAWILELEDIEKGTSRLHQRLTLGQRQSRSTKNRFERGDVLYGKLRPYLNKVIVADQPGFCTTEIVPIKANHAAHGRYLFYWLKHPSFLEYVGAVSHGINMPRLGTEAGNDAPFILAPSAEQKRIADKLDTLLTRVDACRARLDRVSALLKRFRLSVLAAATSGELTAEWRANRAETMSYRRKFLGFPSIELDDLLAEPLRNGKSVRDGTGVPVLRLTALKAGRIDLSQNKRGDWHGLEVSRFLVKAGDFLVSRGNGSLSLVGRGGLIQSSPTQVAFPDTMIRIRPKVDKLLPTFLLRIWEGQRIRDQIERVARTTAGIWKIAQSDLGKILLPVPDIAEQIEIVRRIDVLFHAADRLDAQLQRAQSETVRLTPALLAKAFRGELVRQDSTDEPAQALLARLNARPATAAKSSAQRSRRKALAITT
ncbi:restriction endonuclease subunit S [Rhodoferax sediminis]|uniref:Type I restriction modification DNA specificity domain-containing protein n=1 Tax=Rhodoferax sediminis TaxID=2509614 RepID=A0A515D6D0_9BURK|nr:restriction endonuclease subunit S [Rhodoferax sediminis]QDL35952.1 hypothetical protein EUB48_00580 [Rhodoferax sediminis]